jgi:hypothetical protein
MRPVAYFRRRRRAASVSGGGGGGVPTTDLAGQWIADAGVTLTSGKVSTWADQSGAGIDLTQGTAANRPVVSAAVLNGRDVLEFDGGDVLRSALMAHPVGTMLCAVTRVTGGGYPQVLALVDDSERVFQFRYEDASTLGALSLNTTAPVTAQDTTAVTASAWTVVTMVRRTTGIEVYADGVSDGATLNSGGAPDAGTSERFCVGATAGGSFGLVGQIAELLRYTSETAREDAEAYLTTAWGLGASPASARTFAGYTFAGRTFTGRTHRAGA